MTSKIVWRSGQSKIYKYVLGTERVKGDIFLTPLVPRGFPLTSKIYKYVLGTERVKAAKSGKVLVA